MSAFTRTAQTPLIQTLEAGGWGGGEGGHILGAHIKRVEFTENVIHQSMLSPRNGGQYPGGFNILGHFHVKFFTHGEKD